WRCEPRSTFAVASPRSRFQPADSQPPAARMSVSRHALRILLRILGAKRGLVAGLATGDADMDLVALADRQRRGGDSRFESRFLCVVVVLRGPVMEHRPAVRLGNDHVFG